MQLTEVLILSVPPSATRALIRLEQLVPKLASFSSGSPQAAAEAAPYIGECPSPRSQFWGGGGGRGSALGIVVRKGNHQNQNLHKFAGPLDALRLSVHDSMSTGVFFCQQKNICWRNQTAFVFFKKRRRVNLFSVATERGIWELLGSDPLSLTLHYRYCGNNRTDIPVQSNKTQSLKRRTFIHY